MVEKIMMTQKHDKKESYQYQAQSNLQNQQVQEQQQQNPQKRLRYNRKHWNLKDVSRSENVLKISSVKVKRMFRYESKDQQSRTMQQPNKLQVQHQEYKQQLPKLNLDEFFSNTSNQMDLRNDSTVSKAKNSIALKDTSGPLAAQRKLNDVNNMRPVLLIAIGVISSLLLVVVVGSLLWLWRIRQSGNSSSTKPSCSNSSDTESKKVKSKKKLDTQHRFSTKGIKKITNGSNVAATGANGSNSNNGKGGKQGSSHNPLTLLQQSQAVSAAVVVSVGSAVTTPREKARFHKLTDDDEDQQLKKNNKSPHSSNKLTNTFKKTTIVATRAGGSDVGGDNVDGLDVIKEDNNDSTSNKHGFSTGGNSPLDRLSSLWSTSDRNSVRSSRSTRSPMKKTMNGTCKTINDRAGGGKGIVGGKDLPSTGDSVPNMKASNALTRKFLLQSFRNGGGLSTKSTNLRGNDSIDDDDDNDDIGFSWIVKPNNYDIDDRDDDGSLLYRTELIETGDDNDSILWHGINNQKNGTINGNNKSSGDAGVPSPSNGKYISYAYSLEAGSVDITIGGNHQDHAINLGAGACGLADNDNTNSSSNSSTLQFSTGGFSHHKYKQNRDAMASDFSDSGSSTVSSLMTGGAGGTNGNGVNGVELRYNDTCNDYSFDMMTINTVTNTYNNDINPIVGNSTNDISMMIPSIQPSGTMVTRTVIAPPGKLGIIIDTTIDGPRVYKVSASSTVRDTVHPGDIIIAINDVLTRSMSAVAIASFVRSTNHMQRKLIIWTSSTTSVPINNTFQSTDIATASNLSLHEEKNKSISKDQLKNKSTSSIDTFNNRVIEELDSRDDQHVRKDDLKKRRD